MLKLKMLLFGAIFMIIFSGCSAGAISDSVVISQVQPGPDNAKSNEFIELYNNSNSSVNVTDWCIYYSSPSFSNVQMQTLSWSKKACYTVENSNLHIFLPGKSFSLIAAKNTNSVAWLPSDLAYSATLSLGGGHVKVVDSLGKEIDKLGWGNAVFPEGGFPTIAFPSDGKVISRKAISQEILQDTDVNLNDFELVTPRASYDYGKIYEVQDLCSNIDGIQEYIPDGYTVDELSNCSLPPVDICSNLEGMQVVLPSGYLADDNGDCQPDMCQNIDGLQLALPKGMDVDGSGNCVSHDECPNISDVQPTISEGYIKTSDGFCILKSLPLVISEMLPNAIGVDEDNEFIEIHNPNNQVIKLSDYQLVINDKILNLPVDGAEIQPKAYYVIYNSKLNFTLLNTSSAISVRSNNGSFVSAGTAYQSAPEGQSWSFIEGFWQYTNQPTPGSVNLKSLAEIKEIETGLQPCGPNQYRNPETNRCRNITTSTSSNLVPCGVGYERNPLTNRCRKVSSVLGANTNNLVPCQKGYERNPETNRCRKVASAIPQAEYQPEQMSGQQDDNRIVVWSVLGLVVLAICYGVWEWRKEISKIINKFILALHLRK